MEKFKQLGLNEQATMAAGVVAIILSFFPAYVTVSLGPYSSGATAWHSFATVGILLVIVATALAALKAFAVEYLPAGVPWTIVITACAGLGTLLLLLRGLTVTHAGLGWSGWVLVIAGVVMTAFAALALKASGEDLSQFKQTEG